jgi:hypothetical protein
LLHMADKRMLHAQLSAADYAAYCNSSLIDKKVEDPPPQCKDLKLFAHSYDVRKPPTDSQVCAYTHPQLRLYELLTFSLCVCALCVCACVCVCVCVERGDHRRHGEQAAELEARSDQA